MRHIRNINIEVNKEELRKKLGIKDVDIDDIVSKVLLKLPKQEQQDLHIDYDHIVSVVLDSLPKPKKSKVKQELPIDINSIVDIVLSKIQTSAPQIINTTEVVDMPTEEIVKRINSTDKSVDFKVLRNIPSWLLSSDGNKRDRAIHRGGMARFTQLLDAPQSYSGQGGKILAVKSDMSGLEFVDNPEGSDVDSISNSDGSLTISPTTGNAIASLNLSHGNTWTVMQGFDDGTGNAAYLANTVSGTGGSFTGINIAGTFSTSNNAYTASIASNNDFAAGYFSDVFNSKAVTLANANYSVDGIGVINTDTDYYIGGSPIGVSHWSNDAGYITSAVTSLTGTANQVLVNGGSGSPTTGAVTLTLPQSIATASTPQFQRLGVGVAASSTQSLSVTVGTASHKGVVIKGAASQSGNLLEFQNSASTVLGYLENTTNPNGSALLRVGRGTNYGNIQERAILGYYSPPDSAAGWDRNQATIEGVLEVTNASTAFNTYGGFAMYYRVQKSGAGFVENLSGAGGQVEILSGSGNIGSAYGYYSVYQNASTNTVSEVFGMRSYVGPSAANTTTNFYGSQIWFANSGSSNQTNTYGYHIRNSMGTVGTNTNMYGFYMQDFTSKVTNTWGFYILGATTNNYLEGSLEIDGALNHDGSTVGFYGVTPVARSSTYTATNVTTDRSYDADSTSVNELADVLGTLIADLKATGIIG